MTKALEDAVFSRAWRLYMIVLAEGSVCSISSFSRTRLFFFFGASALTRMHAPSFLSSLSLWVIVPPSPPAYTPFSVLSAELTRLEMKRLGLLRIPLMEGKGRGRKTIPSRARDGGGRIKLQPPASWHTVAELVKKNCTRRETARPVSALSGR